MRIFHHIRTDDSQVVEQIEALGISAVTSGVLS
jgi:hypothetical protein